MRRPLRIATVLATALLIAAGQAGAVAQAAASSGFNDWSCVPSAAHPEPV